MPPLGAEGTLCDCSAPSNRECFYRENLKWGFKVILYSFTQVDKLMVYFSESLRRLEAPSNDQKSLRKVPPMTTVRRPPWIKWRPPSHCPPPFAYFLNTRLVLTGCIIPTCGRSLIHEYELELEMDVIQTARLPNHLYRNSSSRRVDSGHRTSQLSYTWLQLRTPDIFQIPS